MAKFSLIVLLALTCGCFANAQDQPPTQIGTPCQRTCNVAFRCSPYVKQPVYSIVDGQCRVWQNNCLLSSENCSRRNQCQEEFVETTQEECVKHCPQICTKNYIPICASFPRTNENGENVFVSLTFGNTCELNSHVCLNSQPYVNEPTNGECEGTEEADENEEAVETEEDGESEEADDFDEIDESQ